MTADIPQPATGKNAYFIREAEPPGLSARPFLISESFSATVHPSSIPTGAKKNFFPGSSFKECNSFKVRDTSGCFKSL